MIDQNTRRLYDMAKETMPDVYEQLRDIDTALANHAHAGFALLRLRAHLLETVGSLDMTRRAMDIRA